jgi:exonuclease SbcC
VIIDRLEAKNLLKYASLTLEDLPERGLIAISGRNESGKSSIGEAICFALYGRTFSLGLDDGEKIIRWGANQCSVQLRFRIDGEGYEVSRSLDDEGNHSARLSRSAAPDAALARGAEAVENALHGLLGYDFEEFVESFYLAQREITTPHPHSHAVKVMAGVAPLEQVGQEFRDEVDAMSEELVELEQDRERIDEDLEALNIQQGYLQTLEQERQELETANSGLLSQLHELDTVGTGYQERLPERQAAVRSRGTARFFRFLFLLLALLTGGAWAYLTQVPGAELPPQLTELANQQVPDWEQKLPWLLYAAGAFGFLFLLMWMRCSNLDGRIRDFDDYSNALSAELDAAREQLPLEPAEAGAEAPARVDEAGLDRFKRRVAEAMADGGEVEDVLAREAAAFEARREERQRRIAQLDQSLEEERDRLHRASVLRQAWEASAEQSAKRERRIAARELGDELLLGAIRRISQRFNRNLRELVSRTLPLFTEGRYEHLKIDENLAVRVFSSEKRDFLDLDEISSGTQRQIMLAVRLALSQELVARVVRGPQFLILDEPFAFFDRQRARASLDILGQLNEQIAQVWVIAQEFEDESGFDLQIECARDVDTLSAGVAVSGG